MVVTARFVCLAAFGSLLSALHGAEQVALPADSPFSPAKAAPAPASPANEPFELAGVSTIGTKTNVNVYDKTIKKGRWIGVGETTDNISVVSYDPAREQAVVRISGVEKTLTLRKSSLAVTAVATGPAGSAYSYPVPSPTPVANPAGGVATASLPAPAATPPPQQQPPPQPGTVAYQEQEARMLVSDLLEIGVAQRKAYEEAAARKAAAEQAAANGNNPAGTAQTTPAAVPAAR